MLDTVQPQHEQSHTQQYASLLNLSWQTAQNKPIGNSAKADAISCRRTTITCADSLGMKQALDAHGRKGA